MSKALSGGHGSGPVELIYTGLTHPAQWADSNGPSAEGFKEFEKTYYQLFPQAPRNSLDDGRAMTAHDAVMIAVKATRAGLAPERGLPSAEEVINNFAGFHANASFHGATGLIDLNVKTGNPINKPVPILRLEADGTIRFVKLFQPAGAPAS